MTEPSPAPGDGGPPGSGFCAARRTFAATLGLICALAFASFAGQTRGLIGAAGITPAAEFLTLARQQLGAGAWLEVPTLCWLAAGDAMLVGLGLAGVAVSLLMAAGRAPGACALAAWGLYLSLCSVGGPFLSFQWDALLLETSLLAAVWLPWRWRPDWSRETRTQRLARWLLWWLLFRLMFASAVVKLSSGDATWRSLGALRFHFETQPLPLPTAWWMHQLPHGVLRAMEAIMFAIEFIAPLLIVAPRRWRHGAALALVALQLGILLTGNYAFFNWLTIALTITLLDDSAWPARWRPATAGEPSPAAEHPWAFRTFAWAAAIPLLVTLMCFVDSFRVVTRWPEPFASLRAALAPWRSFNPYGLFAVMTTRRPEIFVEGSSDGVNWQAYRFRWKPGRLDEAPAIVAPHQPRLDWQMWFAALGSVEQNPWFLRFAQRLLEGSPEVLALLEYNPFPRTPPRYLRAVVYDYRFTRWGEEGWWHRGEPQLYCPPLSLRRE